MVVAIHGMVSNKRSSSKLAWKNNYSVASCHMGDKGVGKTWSYYAVQKAVFSLVSLEALFDGVMFHFTPLTGCHYIHLIPRNVPCGNS